jgi:hypothetical protein
MRSIVLLGLMSLLALAPIGWSGPVREGSLERLPDLGDHPWRTTKRFLAGERAVVLARGREKSTAILHVTITDSTGKVVTQANGKSPPNSAMVAVFWYPPREGDYTIEVRNTDSEPAGVFVTIK